jgi:Co/Zn/Cd efflux system component
MIGVAAVALVMNVICLKLISVHRDGGVHMTASFIFTQNDVIANVAVIIGGIAVAITGWREWDFVVGIGIGLLVLSGGIRILRRARASRLGQEP